MTEYEEDLRARVLAQYGDGSDLPIAKAAPSTKRKTTRTAAEVSASASKRGKTGESFQVQLDDTHEGMFNRGEGLVLRHHAPTRQVKQWRTFIPGGALCDYSGHVNDYNLVSSYGRIPVVFDAKVLNAKDASYRHATEQQHQLHHLRRAYDAGAAAFILVRADAIERVFVVDFHTHGEYLLKGGSVKLYEQLRAGWTEENRLGRATRVPAYTTQAILPCVEYTIAKGWLWTHLLSHVQTSS